MSDVTWFVALPFQQGDDGPHPGEAHAGGESVSERRRDRRHRFQSQRRLKLGHL